MGLALVAMAEDLGRDMAYRSLEHLLQYGEPHVRCHHLCSQPVTSPLRGMLRFVVSAHVTLPIPLH